MSKMSNKLIRAQEIIFDELERLNDEQLMKSGYGKREIERSNVISNNAQSLIKIVNLQLRLKEVARRNETQEKKLLEELNIIEED
jgi:hypothetical protein